MNERFTDEQIKAYATHFRVGDAIWADGKWNEVTENEKYGDDRITAYVPMNSLAINSGESDYGGFGSCTGFVGGFEKGEKVENPYRVTTLENYKLQGDEKIVWLGESDSFRTFGKTYEVDKEKRYCGDDGILLSVMNNSWGVIPTYEQVKNVKKRNVTDEEFDNLLNEIDKTLEPIKNANQLSHVVQYPTAADREEEVLKIKTFDLLNHDMSKEEIITDLKEIAHIEINNGNYDIVNKVVELVKEWEGMK